MRVEMKIRKVIILFLCIVMPSRIYCDNSISLLNTNLNDIVKINAQWSVGNIPFSYLELNDGSYEIGFIEGVGTFSIGKYVIEKDKITLKYPDVIKSFSIGNTQCVEALNFLFPKKQDSELVLDRNYSNFTLLSGLT